MEEETWEGYPGLWAARNLVQGPAQADLCMTEQCQAQRSFCWCACCLINSPIVHMGGAGYKDRIGRQQHSPRNGRVVTLLNSRASPSDLPKDPVMWSLQYAWCPRGKLSPKCDPPLATARTGESVRKAEVYPLQRILLRTSHQIDMLTEAGSSRKQGILHPCLDVKAATAN